MAGSWTKGRGGEPGDAGATSSSSTDPGHGAAGSGEPPDSPEGDAELLERGATLGRYLVLERLGAGAMGVVYAAYDPELDRKVAIKILRPQEDGKGASGRDRRQARLVREAKAIAKLSHGNVVGIFDVGVHDGQVFLAMEHLAGGTLRDWIAAEKRPWREVVRMFVEIGKGLAAAHAEGLVHRDFKPDNVLLDKSGTPKVVDFGLVRLTSRLDSSTSGSGDMIATLDDRLPTPPPLALAGGDALTRTGALAGTPAYMAPEQFLGKELDARTDQFAFCAALYEALYGERPFKGDTIIGLADSVTAGRMKPAPKGADVPGWVRACVLRGLRIDPDQRYAKIDDLLAALAHDPAKRTRNWAAAGAALAVVAAAVGVTHRLGTNQRTMCKGGGARFAGIWEPGSGASDRKTAIHQAFAHSGLSYAEQAFASVTRLLDQYVARWTGMYAEACEATHVRGEQSAEVLDLRMTCLTERLDNARALSDVFAAADGKVVENAVSAAAALPSLDRCADVALLRAVVRPPEDAATRKRVDDLRVELAQMIALRETGQCARATSKGDALVGEARALGYQPLLAEVLFASAQLGNYCGDDASMLSRFKEAHAVASASRSDDVAAQSAALIPSFAINRRGQVVVAEEWLGVARGDVARLGHETLANAMLAQAEGFLALTNHDYARALAAADRSIDITRRLLGPDDPLTIGWEANKGDWQAAAGMLDEAWNTDVSAREHFERVLGRDHPRVAMVWNNEGEVLNLLGRHDEAEVAYERAVQLFRRSGADADVLGWALTGLGVARLGEKKPGGALAPLEEALSIRIEKHASPALLGETRFALARALWSRPAERQRALAMAASAREDYGEDKKMTGEIEAWLQQSRGEGAPGRVAEVSKERRGP
ncbi:MAG TPA: serine/threonine-protein kinase [Polyangia bacterium]|nr:serine/threonine-protein kinase [Polyangia bacterium]